MVNIERSAVEQGAWAITVLTDPSAPAGRKMVAQITLTGIAEEADAHRQRREAVEALKWYAEACDPAKHRHGFGDVRQKVAEDGGRRARTALGGQ